jgi:two-component system response regulator LytT
VNGLTVLAVDDEPPALDELAYLLRADPRIAEVRTASEATTALRLLEDDAVDAVFLDIRMPGLDGLDLARVLGRFAHPPRVVFVTAHDDAAVEAFALQATDYLLKPLRQDRLGEAVRRVVESRRAEPEAQETIAVELGGVTRFVTVADIRYVEAQGDYARLHTAGGSHLVRVSLAALEEMWGPLGFVRVHRSYLVSAAHIDELRVDAGGHTVTLGGVTLPVSRRHSRELRDRLVRRARP